ncbi:MAG: aryl-sulfate sulfotransferase [Rhodothermales bacterium]
MSEVTFSANERVPIEALLDEPVTVTPNPNGTTPLAAEAVLRTKVPTRVTVQVLGERPLRHRFEELAEEHRVPILGLYPGTENRVEIRLTTSEQAVGVDTLLIATDSLPTFFPTVDIVQADTARMEDGWTLSGLSIAVEGVFHTYPIIFDVNGDVRWYADLSSINDMVLPVERFANGNLLLARGHTIYEQDMLGTEINRWELPGYWIHHDVIEKPDGNLIVAVDKDSFDTKEDHVVELDRTSGVVVNEWDLRQILDVHRRDYIENANDWFHMNAIWYSEPDDALIISGRNQGIVKVSRDNRLLWILAPHKGWGPAGPNAGGHETADFLLTAVDTGGAPYPEPVQQGDADALDFSWAWGQHAPLILPSGNLFVFDNGLQRHFSNSEIFSRGVEYVIDEEAMTVQQAWQYGEERGPEFYSPIISDVDYLPATGNLLIMPGIVAALGPRAVVTEVTYPGKEVVFEASIQLKNRFGNGTLAWGQTDLVYRSERLPLYPR